MSGHSPTKRSEGGFTLVEVAISVAILALGFTTLIGLQSRIVSGYIREENLTKAALFAQYLLTIAEVAESAPEEGTDKGRLVSELDKVGFFDDSFLDDTKEQLKGWDFEREVQSVSYPPFDDVLRRIDLTISWGDGDRDSYKLVHFVRPFEQLPSIPNVP